MAGINSTANITVTGGTYSKNGGAYTSDAGTVVVGDTIAVRATSSADFSTAVNVVLTIGGVEDTYTVTTLAEDATPAAFTLTDVTGATVSTAYTSNTITVAEINTTVAISITGGTYSKNGGAFTADAGTVASGDTVAVKATSSASFETAVDVVLDIGGVTDTYSVTTEAEDGTPAAFSFSDRTNAALETVYTSSITVAGINTTVAITIVGGTYSVNGGAYTSDAGTVDSGDVVSAKGTSSGEIETAVNVVVTIGGVEDTFTITTGDGTTGTRHFPSFPSFPSFPTF